MATLNLLLKKKFKVFHNLDDYCQEINKEARKNLDINHNLLYEPAENMYQKYENQTSLFKSKPLTLHTISCLG